MKSIIGVIFLCSLGCTMYGNQAYEQFQDFEPVGQDQFERFRSAYQSGALGSEGNCYSSHELQMALDYACEYHQDEKLIERLKIEIKQSEHERAGFFEANVKELGVIGVVVVALSVFAWWWKK